MIDVDVEGVTPDAVSAAEVHELLGNDRRQLTIQYLSMYDPGETVDVRRAARAVRSVETGIAPENLRKSSYESAYNSLNANHLPKLDRVGAVAYDGDRKTVTVREDLVRYEFLAAFTEVVVS